MESSCGAPSRKRPTSVGVICELVKTKAQEQYLSNVQSKALLDLDFTPLPPGDPRLSTEVTNEAEKRLIAEISLKISENQNRLQKEKHRMRDEVSQVKEQIQELWFLTENVEKYETKKYRSCVLQVEDTITELQNSNKLLLTQLKCDYLDIVANLPDPESLLKEETKKMPTRKFSTSTDALSSGNDEFNTYKEVQDFDRFLKKHGGHTGGWSEEQHSIFLGLRAKYCNNATRIEEAFKHRIPDIEGEEIRRHEQWFQVYSKLKRERRGAIERWKEARKL